jgi:hypothetical protein
MGPDLYINEANGRVGIGTQAPAEKLDVAGTIRATGLKLTTGAANNRVLTSDGSGAARWRTEGVADLGAFRLTTGDPRFDPAAPATINGFLYHPAKEN